MEALVMNVVDKESKALNLTYDVTKQTNNVVKVNWRHNGQILKSDHFLRCYKHIKHKLWNHPQYDGWDITCKKLDNGKISVLNEGSLFFNDANLLVYEFIICLESS